ASISCISSRVGTLMPSAASTSRSSSTVGSRRSTQIVSSGSAPSEPGCVATSPVALGTKMLNTAKNPASGGEALRAARRPSVAVFGRSQIVDERHQLGRSAGLAHVRRVLPVDHEQRHSCDMVSLGELLGALQVRVHGERVISVGVLVRTDAELFGEALLQLQGVLIGAG